MYDGKWCDVVLKRGNFRTNGVIVALKEKEFRKNIINIKINYMLFADDIVLVAKIKEEFS